MSILNRTIVAFALVMINLSIVEANRVNRHRPQEPEPPFPYDEQEVFFQNEDQVRLAGTLTLPKSNGPFSAVILISGSGPQDRDDSVFGHKPFLVLADHLTRLGIAVLRVDDRGVGKSTGNFSEATSQDFAADALAAVEYLKSRSEIARGKIGLLGHSEGGLIASMVAIQSRDVAFVVTMAGPGLKGDQIVVGAGGADYKGGWISDEVVAEMRTAQERIFAIIKEERNPALLEARMRKEAAVFCGLAARIRAEAPESKKESAETVADAIENESQLFLSPWFRFYLMYDPRTALIKVKCPVLAINGERDFEVPAKENLEAIRKALESGGNKDYTVLMLPNLNHLFQTAATGAISEYEQIEETLSVSALDTLSNWILKHTTLQESNLSRLATEWH
jgi:pimeloyl-ACP methyl ester carboxylesterase